MLASSGVSSSMSLAASSSNWKAQKSNISGLRLLASCQAFSTLRCSKGACSGPKTTKTFLGVASPLALLSVGLVSASAWIYLAPASGSTRVNSMRFPPLARTPDFSNSSRHSAWRLVSPLRAMEVSASVSCGEPAEPSSSSRLLA